MALIDSGASVSVIDSKLLSKLHVKIQSLTNSQPRALFSADGNRLNVLGTCILPVKINGVVTDLRFLVLENLPSKLILGVDALDKCKAKLNFETRTLSLFDDLISVSLRNSYDSTVGVARVAKKCRLNPHSECLVPIYLDDDISLDTDIILEELDVPSVGLKNVKVARVLLSPKQRLKICRVLNLASYPVFLRKHKPIASVSKVSEVLCTIYDGKSTGSCNVLNNTRTNKSQKLDPIFTRNFEQKPTNNVYKASEFNITIDNPDLTTE